MAVVIRLQGLSVTATSVDIRRFFTGLRIPDGGVHIIGGKFEEAFIIFASDEDARRAMSRSGGLIHGSPVTLLLSSKAEMQTVLERTTKNVEPDQTRRFEENTRPPRRSMDHEDAGLTGGRSGYSSPTYHRRHSEMNDPFVVFLNGLPFSVTEEEIQKFFDGLHIDTIVLCKRYNGQNDGKGFVRFVTTQDALQALKRDRKYIGTRYIDVRQATAHSWNMVKGKIPMLDGPKKDFERGRSSEIGHRYPQHSERSRSPVAHRHTPPDEEYCVLLENLSPGMEKENIKQLFNSAKLEDDQILHLTDQDGKRTRTAFVLFKNFHDYCDAISEERRMLFNRWVTVRPISRENMIKLLESQSSNVRVPESSEMFQEGPPSGSVNTYDSAKVCVFVRNLPFDVRKVEVIDFFHGFDVTEDQVQVLRDHKGSGIGQALVLFGSQVAAMEALSLNGRRFLGSEVAVKCITRSQMEELAPEQPVTREKLPRERPFSGPSTEQFFGPDGVSSYQDVRVPNNGNFPETNVEDRINRSYDHGAHGPGSYSSQDWGNWAPGKFGPPVEHSDVPTCVQLFNLPFQIRSEEIYDFCYGYRIIPGSVSLQYEPNGRAKGSATLLFESRQEALAAIRELSGRPVGPRKIQLSLV